MAEILLSKGKIALVDDELFSEMSLWNWYFDGRYAARKEHGVKIYMHRQILSVVGSEVDHRNHNKLDNRRFNLRVCTHKENQRNFPIRVTSTNGFKGIKFYRGRNLKKPWQSAIRIDGRKVSLGYFSTKEQAALAYNQAALKHFGEFACLNEVCG